MEDSEPPVKQKRSNKPYGNAVTPRDIHPGLPETCTVKGCPIEGVELTVWKQCVRRAVCIAMPGGKYQMVVSDDVEVPKETKKVVAAGGKEVEVQSGAKYEVDSYIEEYSCKPPVLFIPIITTLQVLIFVGYVLDLLSHDESTTATMGVPLDSPLIYNPSRRHEAWRYFTYMFLHQGYLHLIFNILVQLILGIPMEMVHKWWRVAIIYLLGVAAGSLGHSVCDRHTFLLGASGGVYALLGAHIAVIIMNWKEMTHDWMSGCDRFFASAPVRLTIWIALAAGDLGLALYIRYWLQEDTNTSYAAHIAGVLTGILIGIPVLLCSVFAPGILIGIPVVRNLQKLPWEEVLFFVSLIVFVLLAVFAIFWNIFYPDYPNRDWTPCC